MMTRGTPILGNLQIFRFVKYTSRWIQQVQLLETENMSGFGTAIPEGLEHIQQNSKTNTCDI